MRGADIGTADRWHRVQGTESDGSLASSCSERPTFPALVHGLGKAVVVLAMQA